MRAAAAESTSELSLRRIRLSDVWTATLIAKRCFPGNEWLMVVFTYLWSLWRAVGLPDFGVMVRRKYLDVGYNDKHARLDTWASAIYGWDVCWIDVATSQLPAADDIVTIVRNWPLAHRLLMVRSRGPIDGFAAVEGIVLEGCLPAPSGAAIHLYCARPNACRSTQGASRVTLIRTCSQPANMTSEFYLIETKNKVIGITGLYCVDFWPDVGWGGWGAVSRSAASRGVICSTLRLTEALAKANGKSWFCIETSDARAYGYARALYKYYGMKLLFDIGNFYINSPIAAEDEKHLVYVKRVE